MSGLLEDLRFAVRQLLKSPGFTITAILTLALGLGANTALFSIMDAMMLRPLAVPRLDRVVTLAEQHDSGNYYRAALANFQDWTRQSHSFDSLSVRVPAGLSMTGAGEPVRVEAAFTSASLFTVMRTQPMAGRAFSDAECQPGRDGVAVLSYGFWQRHFGGDLAVLERRIELDNRIYQIVGIMPKSFQYPPSNDVLLPLAPSPQQMAKRGEHKYYVVGRLRDGVSLKQAQAEMTAIAERLGKAYPATNLGITVRVEPLVDSINGTLTPIYFRLMIGATLFVLLVVCANVANLQFARGIARRPEIAMRTALGASRWRVVRGLLIENVVLGVAGAAAGLVFAQYDLHVSLDMMPPRVARWLAGWSNISLNGRVLAFSLLLAVATGAIAGAVPALEALRVNLVDQLKAGSRTATGSARSHRMRSIFAVVQIALAVALVIGATLMTKGMWSMLRYTDIYEPQKDLVFSVVLPWSRYNTAQKQSEWFTSSVEKLRALPGVEKADVSLALPYSDMAWADDLEIESRPVAPGKFQTALHMPVSEGYFGTLHIPLVSGRAFTRGDAIGAPAVCVVSRSLAAHFFPGESPLGKRLRMGAQRGSTDPWLTIVGVVEDTSYSPWNDQPAEAVYMSIAQMPPLNAYYVVRTTGEPLTIAQDARRALAGIDPGLPLDEMQTYDRFIHERLTPLFYVARNLTEDALIALLLAAIGIFGVMANLVAERTREIGVRLAMGARRADVLKMVLRRAGWLTATGVAAGLVMAFALARVAASLFLGVRPDDPMVFGGITTVVIGVALFSSWIPARRAARIDPMRALRDE